MHVVGTAGHVDHGKSTLVKALTGIDPDRLREEKERGLTIDLGFAWMTLPSGEEISIIDVPGHERFVNNMLAGVGGIDMALLVVAADESVMPQTREHLAILDLLGVARGLVAITKTDLVDSEYIELVEAEVAELLEGTLLEGSRAVPVSATTGRGLEELTVAISEILTETGTRRDVGRPRLPVDRSFTISGFGTVVTGTLIDGTLDVGGEVELVVSGSRSRIRGLQSHKTRSERALPGSRVAVNLSGVAHDAIQRGDVLTTPGWLIPTTSFDAHLRVLPEIPRALRHNMYVTVHTGSNEAIGRLRLLDTDRAEPGEWVWAQLKLDTPVAVVKGDHFVIRSNQATLGGGNIVDAHAQRHRRKHAPLLERLAVMESGSPKEVLAEAVHQYGPIGVAALTGRLDMATKDAQPELDNLEADGDLTVLGAGPNKHYLSKAGWRDLSGRAVGSVSQYHARFPARKGEPKEELRSRLGLSTGLFGPVLERLTDTEVLAETGAVVRSPFHAPTLTPKQEKTGANFVASLTAGDPYSPPTDDLPEQDVLDILTDRGQVVQASDAVVFSAGSFEQMVKQIRVFVSEHGEITVADVRDLFGTSRKYALALLEHLDKTRVTRRVGDARVLR
jgi:selenocysteine-specific elongation factor